MAFNFQKIDQDIASYSGNASGGRFNMDAINNSLVGNSRKNIVDLRQKKVALQKKEKKDSESTSKNAFANSLASSVTFGATDTTNPFGKFIFKAIGEKAPLTQSEKTQYEGNTIKFGELQNRLKTEHPVASTAGEVVGSFVPFGLAESGVKAAAKPVLTRVGSKLGQRLITGGLTMGAVEGAQSATEGNPIGDVAKDTAIGVATGAGFELGLAALGAVGKSVLGKIKAGKVLNETDAAIVEQVNQTLPEQERLMLPAPRMEAGEFGTTSSADSFRWPIEAPQYETTMRQAQEPLALPAPDNRQIVGGFGNYSNMDRMSWPTSNGTITKATETAQRSVVNSLNVGDEIVLPNGVKGSVTERTADTILFEFENGGKAEAKLDGSVGSAILNRINSGEIKVTTPKEPTNVQTFDWDTAGNPASQVFNGRQVMKENPLLAALRRNTNKAEPVAQSPSPSYVPVGGRQVLRNPFANEASAPVSKAIEPKYSPVSGRQVLGAAPSATAQNPATASKSLAMKVPNEEPSAALTENVPRKAGKTEAKNIFQDPIIDNGLKERGFSENIRTDQYSDPALKQSFSTNPETYEVLANTETKGIADSEFAARSAAENYGALKARLATNEMPKASDVPLSRMVANQLVKEGKTAEARDLLADMSVKLTQSGQLSQAANILRSADPETVLATVSKQIEKINQAGRERYGKMWKDFNLTDNEMKTIVNINPGDTVAIQNVIEMVGKRIGAEIPHTGWQKFTEFRRIAMLLNPKTQVRNFLGNVPLMALRKSSEKLAAGIQDVAVDLGLLAKDAQTRTLKVTAENRTLAKSLYDQQKNVFMNTQRWDERTIASIIRDNEKVFKTAPLEKVREFTYFLMQKGDAPFLKSAFVDNASQFIAAQGYKTLRDIPQAVIDKASKEALVATFRDASNLADGLIKLKSHSGPAGVAFDILLPFVTTPVNIARRTIDYSPFGVIKLLNVKNRQEAAQVIDILTQGATGTAVLATGFLLAKLGWITSGESKDYDKNAFLQAIGIQPYSIMGKFSYDWMQPVGTTLAIGAEIYNAAKGKTELLNAIESSLAAGGDSIANLTFFANIQDLFSGYGSLTERLARNTVEGAASQVIPSIVGQAARTIDPTVRSTYTGGNVFQNIFAQSKSKIPGALTTLPASYDIRGQEKKRIQNPLLNALQQTVIPGTINTGTQNTTDKEILRVYDQTQSNSVFPHYASGSFTKSGVKYEMNGEERSKYQQVLGTETYKNLSVLFNKADYIYADDAEKAKLIANEIEKANTTAKDSIIKSRK